MLFSAILSITKNHYRATYLTLTIINSQSYQFQDGTIINSQSYQFQDGVVNAATVHASYAFTELNRAKYTIRINAF